MEKQVKWTTTVSYNPLLNSYALPQWTSPSTTDIILLRAPRMSAVTDAGAARMPAISRETPSLTTEDLHTIRTKLATSINAEEPINYKSRMWMQETLRSVKNTEEKSYWQTCS